MIRRYRLFSTRIAAELAEIRRASQKALEACRAAQSVGPNQRFLIDAAALNLHTFYGGVERIFEFVAREIDGSLPGGPSSHRDLLSQMSMDVPGGRPAVIGPTTRASLEEFPHFRHLVRNLYTWDFVPAKINDLAEQLPGAMDSLEADLTGFREFLDSSSHADEPPAGL